MIFITMSVTKPYKSALAPNTFANSKMNEYEHKDEQLGAKGEPIVGVK
jgi:hypothetical protein